MRIMCSTLDTSNSDHLKHDEKVIYLIHQHLRARTQCCRDRIIKRVLETFLIAHDRIKEVCSIDMRDLRMCLLF